MNPLAIALLGYAVLSLIQKDGEEEGATTWEDRKSISPIDAPSSPSIEWEYFNKPKPPPAMQDKQRRPLPIEGAWAYGWLYIYITAAGGAGLYKDPLIQKYLADHNFTANDIMDFTNTTLATYGSVRTMTGSVPFLSDVIGAAAGLIHGFVQFAQTTFDRDSQVREMFGVWKEAFYGPLGRPPMALFHGLQTYSRELNAGGDTSIDPNLIGDLGNPYSPAIMLHVRLLKMWLTIEKHYKAPKKKDIQLAVYGKMVLKNKDGNTTPIFVDYDGLTKKEGMNLWAGNQILPFPYYFYAFDPNAMFHYSTVKGSWGRYAKTMNHKSKEDAFSFTLSDFDAVFPKGLAVFDLEVDPTKHTSSTISIAKQDRSRVVRATRNDWFESRWESS